MMRRGVESPPDLQTCRDLFIGRSRRSPHSSPPNPDSPSYPPWLGQTTAPHRSYQLEVQKPLTSKLVTLLPSQQADRTSRRGLLLTRTLRPSGLARDPHAAGPSTPSDGSPSSESPLLPDSSSGSFPPVLE